MAVLRPDRPPSIRLISSRRRIPATRRRYQRCVSGSRSCSARRWGEPGVLVRRLLGGCATPLRSAEPAIAAPTRAPSTRPRANGCRALILARRGIRHAAQPIEEGSRSLTVGPSGASARGSRRSRRSRSRPRRAATQAPAGSRRSAGCRSRAGRQAHRRPTPPARRRQQQRQLAAGRSSDEDVEARVEHADEQGEDRGGTDHQALARSSGDAATGRADPAATDDDVAVVQNAGLAGRRGPDRLVGLDDPLAAAGGLGRCRGADRGGDRLCTVTDPSISPERGRPSAGGRPRS